MEWLWALAAGALGVLWLLLKGESSGKQKEQGKQAERTVERVQEAKRVSDGVRRTNADERRERLRKHSDK